MSTLTSIRIETWGDKFLVVGEFENYHSIPRREFATYREALRELSKMVQREEVKYDSNNRYGFNR